MQPRRSAIPSSPKASAIARDASSTAKEAQKLLPRLLGKLLATQEVRVLCTSRVAIPSTRARTVEVKPLSPNDAARLFRELAMEALPADLRPLDALRRRLGQQAL